MAAEPKARILIVDDEAAQTRALCDALSDCGFETTGRTSGEAALVELRERRFDLLLSDLMMPDMDGITLIRAALQLDSDQQGIIMTGAGTIDTAIEAMKAGAFDYVLKPFKLTAILPVLSRALAVRELRAANAALQLAVRNRTAELEASNRELESFSYSVSHDLRAPLRAIDGFSHLLVEEFSSQIPIEARALLDRVCANALKMGQLIDDLLRLSRFSREPLARARVAMTPLANEVFQELLEACGDRRVEVRVGDLPDCIGDRGLIRQVLVNLLSNAVKFSLGREPAEVELSGYREGGESIFRVRDNGAGFDMGHADRLFGVFQRLHSAEEFEGTGIGLSIVQRILQRHGGRVWAESAVGQGATFHFALPGVGAG